MSVSSGYLADPRSMSDEMLHSWIGNFSAQPPTMDYMVEFSWAQAVNAEAKRRFHYECGCPRGEGDPGYCQQCAEHEAQQAAECEAERRNEQALAEAGMY